MRRPDIPVSENRDCLPAGRGIPKHTVHIDVSVVTEMSFTPKYQIYSK